MVPFEPTVGRPALSKSNITELILVNCSGSLYGVHAGEILFSLVAAGGWDFIFNQHLGLGWIGSDEMKMRSSPTSSIAGIIYLRLNMLGHLMYHLDSW